MFKAIGGDHKEYGPVTAEELRQWIADGRLSGQSLVQLEGTGQWNPLSSFPDFGEDLRAQALRFGSTLSTSPVAGTGEATDLLTRRPELHVGRCLELSGRLLGTNFGLLTAACFLVWLPSFISLYFPPIGLAVWLLQGVLYGGLYSLYLARIRGAPASVNQVFAGFGFGFAHLLLAGVLVSLLSSIGLILCLVPGVILAVIWCFAVPVVVDRKLDAWRAMELSRKVTGRVFFQVLGLLILAFLPWLLMNLYAQVKVAATLLPLFANLGSTTPLDPSQFLELVKQTAEASAPLVKMTNLVLLFNLPFATGAMMYAYEELFGSRPTPEP